MYLTQIPCACLQLGNAIMENDLFTNRQSKPRFLSVSQHALAISLWVLLIPPSLDWPCMWLYTKTKRASSIELHVTRGGDQLANHFFFKKK